MRIDSKKVSARFEFRSLQKKRANMVDLDECIEAPREKKMLCNKPLITKIFFDTAENAPAKVWAI